MLSTLSVGVAPYLSAHRALGMAFHSDSVPSQNVHSADIKLQRFELFIQGAGFTPVEPEKEWRYKVFVQRCKCGLSTFQQFLDHKLHHHKAYRGYII